MTKLKLTNKSQGNKMKVFVCGFCKKRGIRFASTRKGLREHLRKEHFKKRELTNIDDGKNVMKQKHWITEEVDETLCSIDCAREGEHKEAKRIAEFIVQSINKNEMEESA